MKKILIVLFLLLAGCGGVNAPSNDRYIDSYVCYSANGTVVDSDEGVQLQGYIGPDANVVAVYYPDGSQKRISVTNCVFTYGG